MLYGISFSSQGIGGTSATAVYNLEFEDDLAQVTLELLPDWQSRKISNINIQIKELPLHPRYTQISEGLFNH